MKRYLCCLVAVGLLVGVTGRATAQPSYTFTTLDAPGSRAAKSSNRDLSVGGGSISRNSKESGRGTLRVLEGRGLQVFHALERLKACHPGS
jgi:hypothetical protein